MNLNPKLRNRLAALAVFAGMFVVGLAVTVLAQGRSILGTSGPTIAWVAATPESLITGSIGDLALRTDAAPTFYAKELGSSSTGWAALGHLRENYRGGYCQNVTAGTNWSLPASNPAVAACLTGSNTNLGVLEFADGANALSAQQLIQMPVNWANATLDARIYWSTTATSGNVVWQLQTICVADNESPDPAFNSASTVTDAALGNASRANIALITGMTVTGCAAGELLNLKLTRDPAHASDTLAATARLLNLELVFKRGA